MTLIPILLAIAIVGVLLVGFLFRQPATSGRGVDPISSSIVVASATALMIAGAYHDHNDTPANDELIRAGG